MGHNKNNFACNGYKKKSKLVQGGNSAAEKGGRLVEFSTTTRTVHKRDVWEVTSNYINTSFTINNDSISCYIKCDKTPLDNQRTEYFLGKSWY